MTFTVGDKVTHSEHGNGVITYGPLAPNGHENRFLFRTDDGALERVVADWRLTKRAGFAVGDEAMLAGTSRVRVVGGPVVDTFGVNLYLVEYMDGVFSGRGVSAYESALKPVPAPEAEPIKVGDRVRVLFAAHAEEHHGKIGTVTSVTADWEPHDGSGLHRYLVDLGDHMIDVRDLEKVGDCTEIGGATYDLNSRYRDREGDVWRFERVDGTVRGGIDPEYPVDACSMSLESVIRAYGPLTRVTEV